MSERIYGITLLLLGITSLLFGVLVLYVMNTITIMINLLSNFYPPAAAGISAQFNTYLIFGWIFGILEALLGIFSIISAIKIFSERE